MSLKHRSGVPDRVQDNKIERAGSLIPVITTHVVAPDSGANETTREALSFSTATRSTSRAAKPAGSAMRRRLPPTAKAPNGKKIKNVEVFINLKN